LKQRYAVYETDALLGALEHDGCALIGNAVPPALCAEAREKIDALRPLHWDEVHDDSRGVAGGRHMDRYLCVFNRDPFWLRFIDRPGVIELAEAALGNDCHIMGETAWRSHPGYTSEDLHFDYLPPDSGAPAALFIVTAQFYLNDVTPELAPTRVVPGSHAAARAPKPDEAQWNGRAAETILATTGECLVFRSDVWHAGSDNSTPRDTRYLLQVHYSRREIAQHFSPYLDWRFNPDVLHAASARQRRLLGDHAPGAYD
jgi:hypothetical protein